MKWLNKYGFILFTVLCLQGVSMLVHFFIKDYIENKYINNIESSNKVQFIQTYDNYKLIAESLFVDIVRDYNISTLLDGINKKSDLEKDIIRNKLYDDLVLFYDRHKKLFDLKQMHFHLLDNTSFLRFHMPDKYGDNLTKIRDTVKYVNRFGKKVDGFEEGRVFSGFRYVFPILGDSGKQLGSVEISLSVKSFIDIFEKNIENRNFDFIILKEVVDKKVWGNFKIKNYIEAELFSDFYREVDINNFHSIDFSSFDKNDLEHIYENIIDGNDFSIISSNDSYFVTTFLSIKNAITSKNIGFIIIQRSSKELFVLNLFFVFSLITSSIAHIMLLYFLIKNKIAKDKLYKEANIDSLTGIYNRRYFFAKSKILLNESEINNLPICLVMFDIDLFKNVNDNYGHNIGDIVLKEFTSKIIASLKSEMLFARIGGEEFVLISNNNEPELITLLGSLKDDIESMQVQTSKGIIKITTSIGYTIFDINDYTIDDLLHKADKALYMSKDGGRNMISKYLRNNKKGE